MINDMKIFLFGKATCHHCKEKERKNYKKKMPTVFSLRIGTPYLHNLLILKFENIAVGMANSADPDQTSHLRSTTFFRGD